MVPTGSTRQRTEDTAKDTIVISGSDDDKYYVDANGAKVTNTWVSVDNADDNECAD